MTPRVCFAVKVWPKDGSICGVNNVSTLLEEAIILVAADATDSDGMVMLVDDITTAKQSVLQRYSHTETQTILYCARLPHETKSNSHVLLV